MAELNTTPNAKNISHRSGKKPLKVDLTAMVDLAFLLITFFMLTTTLAKPKIMQLAMPADMRSEPQAASRSLTICLGNNDKALWYLGTADDPIIPATVTTYSKDGLRRVISNMRQRVKQTTGKTLLVLVKPSVRSVYANLVNTIDELNIGSVDQYAIVDADGKDIAMLQSKHVY